MPSTRPTTRGSKMLTRKSLSGLWVKDRMGASSTSLSTSSTNSYRRGWIPTVYSSQQRLRGCLLVVLSLLIKKQRTCHLLITGCQGTKIVTQWACLRGPKRSHRAQSWSGCAPIRALRRSMSVSHPRSTKKSTQLCSKGSSFRIIKRELGLLFQPMRRSEMKSKYLTSSPQKWPWTARWPLRTQTQSETSWKWRSATSFRIIATPLRMTTVGNLHS